MNNCKRYSVYAVGVAPNGDIVAAKNGNENECTNIPGNCGCIHAEEMVLRQMPNPQKVIVSCSPCKGCAEKLVNAGVEEVIYIDDYRKQEGIIFLIDNHVKVGKMHGQHIQHI